MLKDFRLSPTSNEMHIENFGFVLTASLSQRVSQLLRIKLSTFIGEWYLDITKGLPFFDDVLIKAPTDFFDAYVKQAILSTEGVTGIVQYTSTYFPTSRTYSLAFIVSLIDGTTLSLEV